MRIRAQMIKYGGNSGNLRFLLVVEMSNYGQDESGTGTATMHAATKVPSTSVACLAVPRSTLAQSGSPNEGGEGGGERGGNEIVRR